MNADKQITAVRIEHEDDQDWQRAEALNDGVREFIGIIAKAEINVAGIIQTVRSGGLWGIESDSDNEYLASVEAEQLAELRDQLMALGFTKRNIDRAFSKLN